MNKIEGRYNDHFFKNNLILYYNPNKAGLFQNSLFLSGGHLTLVPFIFQEKLIQ